MDGYRFLMQNYRVGDKICIFGTTPCVFFFFDREPYADSYKGFSRGAYTARALGGMLFKVERVIFASTI
jgi:uncharacterized protein (DUF2235 family)